MALKATRGLQRLGRPAGQHRSPAAGLGRMSSLLSVQGGTPRQPSCLACLWTSAGHCIQRYGCQRLQLAWALRRRSVSVAVRGLSVLASSSVGLHRDSAVRFRLTQLHPPAPAEQRSFQERLDGCSSSRQVVRLLRGVDTVSDTMAAAALHRVADLEQEDGGGLKDPSVLQQDALRSLCFQLERDSERLSHAGLVSALLACTRLCLDRRSTLLGQLVSESRERLGRGAGMSVGELCMLGRALLSLEGPGGTMLGQVMEQVQKQDPGGWSVPELTAVYGLLQEGAGEGGRYQDLLSAMHAHALALAPRMQPSALSALLGALVALEQSQAVPLVIALVKQAVRHAAKLSDGELALVLGALMHFGHNDHYFVKEMERHIPKVAFTSHPETVTKVMQYFGQRNILSQPVFDAVAESFVYRADDLTTSQVARQISPFGKLGYLPPNSGQLFRKVEAVLHARSSRFQPRTLLGLLHACTLVERHPVNFLSTLFSDHFLQQLQETGMDRIVLAQLTQLYMTMKLECPFYKGPSLLRKYRLQSLASAGQSVETAVDRALYSSVTHGLLQLLGARHYYASNVLTPYCYTLDVEVKLDEEGYVLPASHADDVYKRIAICIDGQKRFSVNTRRLLGKEAIKQRHLRLLGYEVVQIPYDEFEKLNGKTEIVEYLHKQIFTHSYRLSW